MGCDIHAVIEFKEFPGEWDTFAILESEPRWYSLFGALTNGIVRADKPEGMIPIDPRGLPEDVDYYTKEAFDRVGDHTPSWVTSDELEQALKAISSEDGYYNIVLTVMREIEKLYPTRLIFWFDN